jgi:hypothetical protein
LGRCVFADGKDDDVDDYDDVDGAGDAAASGTTSELADGLAEKAELGHRGGGSIRVWPTAKTTTSTTTTTSTGLAMRRRAERRASWRTAWQKRRS